MKHLTEADRAHVEKLMDEMLEKLLLGRRNACEARKNSGGRFKRRGLRDLFLSNRESVRICGSVARQHARQVQAESVRKNCLRHGMEAEMSSSRQRDKSSKRHCADWRKGIFIKELEEALLDGRSILRCTA